MNSKKEDIDTIMEEMEAATPKIDVNNTFEKLVQDDVDAKTSVTVTAKNISDHTDAKALETVKSWFKSLPKKPGEIYPSRPTEERYYDTNHGNIGLAIIFNQMTFKGEKERLGSKKDSNDLEDVLYNLGFNVTVHEDLTEKQIKKILHDVSQENHSDNDCFLVAIMTHGETNGKIHASDSQFMVQDLYEYFTGDKCETLIGKPKLFFIQACRGSMVDPGIMMKPTPKARMLVHSDTVDAKAEAPFVIPSLCDLLIMYSTADGFYSFRNPTEGSWFIQALCEELKENPQEELMTILTGVNRRVAFAKQSFVPNNPNWDAMKQMPNIVSMLTKTFYFRKSKARQQLKNASI